VVRCGGGASSAVLANPGRVEVNGLWVYAYIVMPIVVVALGYAAVRWDERDLHNPVDKRHGPAE
jgi:hypothetical protein